MKIFTSCKKLLPRHFPFIFKIQASFCRIEKSQIYKIGWLLLPTLFGVQVPLKSISVNANHFQGIVGDFTGKDNDDNFEVNPEILHKSGRRYEIKSLAGLRNDEKPRTSCNITKLEDNHENDSSTKSKEDFQAGKIYSQANFL